MEELGEPHFHDLGDHGNQVSKLHTYISMYPFSHY